MAKSAVASGAPAIKPPPGKGGSDHPGQDLIGSSPGLKRLLVQARERGVVTVDEINAALPEEEVSPDQLDELIAMFEEMGVSVGRDEDGGNGSRRPRPISRASDDDGEGPAAIDDEDLGRTDDPVRMYLREMGTIELLSREGEIEIAKRIEAGRNTVLEALCESPLTMRAIISWRDAIGEGKVLLRDVIDLEATYVAEPQGEDSERRPRRSRRPRPAGRGRRQGGRERGRAEERGRGGFRRGCSVAVGDGGLGPRRRARDLRSDRADLRAGARAAGAAAGRAAA